MSSSFSESLPKNKQRALTAALLSIIPGLGQLYNKHFEKGFAFILADLLTALLFISLIDGAPPCCPRSYYSWVYAWPVGSVPFMLLQTLTVAYIIFAQFDAYSDALKPTGKSPSPNFALCETACASYVLHLSAILALSALLLYRVIPECRPFEKPQIVLTFDLSPEEDANESSGENEGAKESEQATDGANHSRGFKWNENILSNPSGKFNSKNSKQSKSNEIASQETAAIASKKILNKQQEQNPQEMKSLGELSAASLINPEKIEATEIESTNPEQMNESISSNLNLNESPRLIASLPQIKIPSAESNKSTDNGSETQDNKAPAMLGFMDSELSEDPEMRYLWASMSSQLSSYIKENPLKGEGLAVCTFKCGSNGDISGLTAAPARSELADSLKTALNKMPRINSVNNRTLYFQVKASNDNGTFVSLEINSSAQKISSSTLSDFKHQVALQAYLKSFKKAVYNSWNPPVQEAVKPVMVGLKITSDGRIVDQHIVESSGDPRQDRAALNAALTLTRWAQPPEGTDEDVELCIVLKKCESCDEEKKAASINTLPNLNPFTRQ
ncbi:MAG: TonB family protein [Candidatus Obscuribacterales bacterium]|nr:TonB family protein [Candidatus Obscuribacterales bacterium]